MNILLGLVIALAVALGGAGVQTWRLGHAQDTIAGMKALAAAQEAETKRVIERQKRDSDEAEARSKRALADIRSKYDRLRGSGAGQLPAVPDTTPVADDGARDSRLLEVLRLAEEQTRQLEELQAWVRGQGR